MARTRKQALKAYYKLATQVRWHWSTLIMCTGRTLAVDNGHEHSYCHKHHVQVIKLLYISNLAAVWQCYKSCYAVTPL